MSWFLRTIKRTITGGESEEPNTYSLPENYDFVKESDCIACENPCEEHKQYPNYLKIDREKSLEGTVKPYFKQLLISTGKHDWPERIEEVEGSLPAEIAKRISSRKGPRVIVTNTSRPIPKGLKEGNHEVIILPSNKLVRNVNLENLDCFLDTYVYSEEQHMEEFEVENLPEEHGFILICSHRRRDKRCGVTAPILKEEFHRILLEKELQDKVEVLLVSHIGGHKFAGNVIIYPVGVWYGRVKSCHVKAIVEKTLLDEHIIEELYRGRLDW
ncbi:hypothetical protein K7432_007048 [Basidiobolus ranarum]|uniref:Uncharacterized protein n=1 Tax=Basidiobolus ranarum TaxID=34480 RepID=A0ABR2W0Y2_9FUNG